MDVLLDGLRETLTDGWGLWGVCGTLLFSGSFLVQWIASERRGESVVPLAFWYLRLAGGMMLFTYALFGRADGVFTLGQTFGVVVYSRNLVLIHRKRARVAAADAHHAVASPESGTSSDAAVDADHDAPA